jgi:hypothetical protein
MRHLLVRLPLALLAMAAVACSGDRVTAPDSAEDALQAADGFARLADSVALLQGNDAALPYRDAADQIRAAQQVSRIAVTIDGVTERWNAVAGERVFSIVCPADASSTALGVPCLSGPVLTRTLIAWRGIAPRRLLFLTAPMEAGDIGSFSAPTPAVFVPAFLQYLEGRDRIWVGTSGKFTSSVKKGDPCPAPMGLAAPQATDITCNLAELLWTFEATAEPARGLPFANAARITHKIAVNKAAVAGTSITVTFSAPPRVPLPLSGTLKTTVNAAANDVTLAFTVRNETDRPFELHFRSTQEYDFRIATPGGEVVWTWSALADFAATATTRVIPAHESVTYTAHWTPTRRGPLLASAVLTTSDSPRLLVMVPVTVP